MEENFEKAMNFIFKWEGGYVNDGNDPGGETNYGISKRAYPNLDIKNLTKDEAKQIYYRDYWEKSGCFDLPYPLDIVVLDTAVNLGVNRASRFALQTDDWKDYLFLRMKHYCNLNMARYIKGWTNRVIDLWEVCK